MNLVWLADGKGRGAKRFTKVIYKGNAPPTEPFKTASGSEQTRSPYFGGLKPRGGGIIIWGKGVDEAHVEWRPFTPSRGVSTHGLPCWT